MRNSALEFPRRDLPMYIVMSVLGNSWPLSLAGISFWNMSLARQVFVGVLAYTWTPC